jgi:hypothetical protein
MNDQIQPHRDLPEFYRRWMAGDPDPDLSTALRADLGRFGIEVSAARGKALLERALEEQEVVRAQRLVIEKLISQPGVPLVSTQSREFEDRRLGGAPLQRILEDLQDSPGPIRRAVAGSPDFGPTARLRSVPKLIVLDGFEQSNLGAVAIERQAHIDRQGVVHLDLECQVRRDAAPVWWDGLAVVQHGQAFCGIWSYHEETDGRLQIKGSAPMKRVQLDAPADLAQLDVAITLFPGLHDPHLPEEG